MAQELNIRALEKYLKDIKDENPNRELFVYLDNKRLVVSEGVMKQPLFMSVELNDYC